MDLTLIDNRGKEEFSFHIKAKRSSNYEEQQTEKCDSKVTPDMTSHQRIMSFQQPSHSVTSNSMQY